MADLVAADLTYAAEEPVNGERVGQSRTRRVLKVTTGSGDYPTGGLPLDASLMGVPNSVESVKILEPSIADEYQYVWDHSANKIKVIIDDGSTGIPAEHGNSAFTSPDELIIEVIGW